MKTKAEIYQWLSQHDWYESFKTKTIRYHPITSLDEYLSKLIKENKSETIIYSAFSWYNTNEGWNFWSEINDKYLKWLKAMKQTIEIEVPEGKKAVWKDGKVVFEDIKPELPKTWKEFCEKYPVKKEECYINRYSNIFHVEIDEDRGYLVDKTILPSEEAAEAHLALMQLHQLRDCYRQGWVPNWGNGGDNKWCIVNQWGIKSVLSSSATRFFLAFPTKKIAEEFLHNFEDLIKKAGDLI